MPSAHFLTLNEFCNKLLLSFSYISLASLVSDAIWSPAGIRRLVAELIMFAVSFGCALDVNTFLRIEFKKVDSDGVVPV